MLKYFSVLDFFIVIFAPLPSNISLTKATLFPPDDTINLYK